MKKTLVIIASAVVLYVSLAYILPYLVGVPMAAYHSYKNWNEVVQETKVFDTVSNTSRFPKAQGIVNDFGNILTQPQRLELSNLLSDYEKNTTRQIVIVTIDSIAPYTDLQQFASTLGTEWGVGTQQKNNGVVIAFSKALRQTAIATGIGTEEVLTNALCVQIIETNMLPHFKKEKYYKGLKSGVQSIIQEWY